MYRLVLIVLQRNLVVLLQSSVLTLEDSTLDVDQVDNLIKFCPTKEEMDMLKVGYGESVNS